jgi:hypothetical protein
MVKALSIDMRTRVLAAGRGDVKGRDVYLAVSVDDRVPTFKVKREIAPELDSLDRVRTTILFKSDKDGRP